MNPSDVLNAVLLPLRDDPLLLPGVAIADAIGAGGLRPAAAGAPDWFAGWIRWQDLDLPVLHFERLNGGAATDPGRRARIVVLQPVTAGAGLPRLGLLCDGHPQLLSLSREALEARPLRDGDDRRLLLARVAAEGREARVPDLAEIETRLAALLEDGGAAAAPAS